MCASAMCVLLAVHGPLAAQTVFGSTAPLPTLTTRPTLPDLGDSASDDLSPMTERKLGDEIMRQAHEAGDVMEDPEATEYLNQFGAGLVAHAGPRGAAQDFTFFFVNDPTVNAFALPGGYIGVNSGLIVATQSEPELASVMAHEMGHVIQRHIARAIAREKQTSMIALATMLLGMVAAVKSRSPDAGQAAMMAGQGYAIQDQLNFGRDAEREADRVGFQILQDAHYDVNAMTTFFGRLQQVTRIYETATPAFLLTHPLTTERMADIQNRVREAPYRQRPDSLDFHLVRARLRVLQDTTVQGLRDTRTAFEDQLKTRSFANEAAVHYGLAVLLLKQNDAKGAQRELDEVKKRIATPDAIVANCAIDVKQALGDATGAIELAKAARAQFPESRMIAQNYADTLQQAGRDDEAIAYLRDQLRLYKSEPVLYELLAKSYAAKGDAMVSHRLLGEAYLHRGSIRAALQQMQIARTSAPVDADFYEVSQIDARVRELQVRAEELRKAEKESGSRSLRLEVTRSDGPSAPRVEVDSQGLRRSGLESEAGRDLMGRDPLQR
jgi:predicted Zn-dependent protease